MMAVEIRGQVVFDLLRPKPFRDRLTAQVSTFLRATAALSLPALVVCLGAHRRCAPTTDNGARQEADLPDKR